ncbi:hypothetical protein NQ318_019927 [Aromia moschata]|uniref:C3H1-type domain-containing protein n=1 Tax=Aromia moschata TaxID=1265417 RepID=A0AAV8Y6C7_9CUCU|nr:hypothetical protein NQ318_019927 [Aromia moschata]
MDSEEYNVYKQQLIQVNQALLTSPEGAEREELLVLKGNIEELLSLFNAEEESTEPSTSKDPLSDEFALFMAKMEKEGAIENPTKKCDTKKLEDFKELEGTKCRAPHTHQWGHVAYHNAMICSVIPETMSNFDEVKVRVLFINPTHQEMLPCPYYYKSECKFSEDKCRFSHGEIVLYSSLQEYVEPKFDLLSTGSTVLAKQSNNLWYRAVIRKLYGEKCLVNNEENVNDYETSEDDETNADDKDDVINMSLMVTPPSDKLGDWGKIHKGYWIKADAKNGLHSRYWLRKELRRQTRSSNSGDFTRWEIFSDGETGRGSDHCMKLREQAGDDKDLFSVERKLKKMQRKQELQNQKAYERQCKKVDVFNFINETLSEGNNQKSEDSHTERQKIKKECSRSLNIRSLQIADNIRRIERDLETLKNSLARHTDASSNIHLKLKDKLVYRQDQLKMYQTQALMIRNEQSLRNDKKENDRLLMLFFYSI